ncbi:cold-shock protein [Paenibacillus sp. YYML68]|uniref:cold-shock protein n=1 Tax=Paenibacillus sp. YYML68 TaxID=2909250 RepID=UPI002492DC22|nr:cold-shock protein [Paenibacillus sp. YYML68]
MYFRKPSLDQLPHEETKIWCCSKDNCKGWMRDNFAFDVTPTCPLCQAPMESGFKQLPIVDNSNDLRHPKQLKKGVQM